MVILTGVLHSLQQELPSRTLIDNTDKKTTKETFHRWRRRCIAPQRQEAWSKQKYMFLQGLK
jgi:hypothetical protein